MTIFRTVVLLVLCAPLALQLVFYATGSLDFIGLDTEKMYYLNGQLSTIRAMLWLLISVLAAIAGRWVFGFLKSPELSKSI